MPALLLFGATGMGKTRIVQRFVREHGSHFDPQRGTTRLPVVALQMPPTPHERDFYEEVLVAMEAVLPVKLSVSNLRQRVRVLARQLGVRMLIIDEIHSLLSGTFRAQRIFLNALRFHCPQHRDVLWSCCSDCRDVASLGWGLGRGQPPTRGCGRCALRPEIAFWEAPQPLSTREERVLALETALLAAVASEGGAQRVADPRWVGVVKPEDFVRLVGELIAMLSWPDACGGTHLLAHLQQGSCSAHAYVSGPLSLGSQAFGRLRQQERFELLAGVVKLLGTGPGEEDQPRGDPNPFCCVYGPMSASGRRQFLARLQSWHERVRVKALAAATCF